MRNILCSFVICTYRRPDKLRQCLLSLAAELENSGLAAEILVVDNSPEAGVKEQVNKLGLQSVQWRYIHEAAEGLAHARNRGMAEAGGEYIFYLDDDARVEAGFAKRLFDTLETGEYDAFGAYVKGFTPGNAPVWLKPEYYHPAPFMHEKGLLQNGYLHGGASAYRTEVLRLLGGYDTELGMRGHELSYGEDTELEKRLRQRNFRIGYDPELVVHHEIRYDTIKKLFRSHYLRTKTFYSLYEERITGQVLRSLASCVFESAKAFAKGALSMLTKKPYYLQNWYLETVFPLLKARAIWETGGPQYLRNNRWIYRRDRHFKLLMRHFGRTITNLQFVQIGGCDGMSFDPVYPWIKRYQWEGVVVEVLPHLVKTLERTYADMPNVKIFAMAISDRDGTAEMQYVEAGDAGLPEWTKGIASLVPERNALNPLFRLNDEWKQYIKKTQVETRSWPSFLEAYDIEKIDLLVLDTEGLEYRILRQIHNLPPLVLFEFVHLPVNELRAVFHLFSHGRLQYFLIQISDTDIFAVRQDYLSTGMRIKMNLPLLNPHE